MAPHDMTAKAMPFLYIAHPFYCPDLMSIGGPALCSHSSLVYSCPYICPWSSPAPTPILSSSPIELLSILQNHSAFTSGPWHSSIPPPYAFPIPWLNKHHLITDLLVLNSLGCLRKSHQLLVREGNGASPKLLTQKN